MRTIKLVVIGPSGVGKTSLRSQYISGRFTTGYRSTIGADFITKSLPHHSNPEESVTLQIWDTAGQERFSSLSSAFFRGADAALLMFDANDIKTLEALKKWWEEFKDRAPLQDEDANEFCCVVVGNKVDVSSDNRIGEEQALKFLDEMIPPEEQDIDAQPDATPSIDIAARGRKPTSHQGSRSSHSKSLLRGGSTMSTVRTGFSSYHTPASSIFENFESARSSPIPPSRSPSPGSSPLTSMRRIPSIASSVSSTQTITPGVFARSHIDSMPSISQQQEAHASKSIYPTPPQRRPKLFFASAKTGAGVPDIFEYIAQRVTKRMEFYDDIEARTLHMRERTNDTVELGAGPQPESKSKFGCC